MVTAEHDEAFRLYDVAGRINDGPYRRGFHHGVWTALQMIRSEQDKAMLSEYEDRVAYWRFYGDLSKFEIPPR